MTSINIPLGYRNANIVLSLIAKLNDMAAAEQRHLGNHAERGERVPLPPVRCAPWCDQGDGHPRRFVAEDQACWSPSEYVEFSLMPAAMDDGASFPQHIGVMTRHIPGEDAVVYLHLDQIPIRGPVPSPWDILDESLHLTAAEARRLGELLLQEAARVDERSADVAKTTTVRTEGTARQ